MTPPSDDANLITNTRRLAARLQEFKLSKDGDRFTLSDAGGGPDVTGTLAEVSGRLEEEAELRKSLGTLLKMADDYGVDHMITFIETIKEN